MASCVSSAGSGDGVGRRSLAVRIKRSLSRRALRNRIPNPILDAGIPGGLSQQHGAAALAVAVRAESDEWCDRGFPVGTDRAWATTGAVAAGFRGNGDGPTRKRIDLLPADGKYDRGSGVGEVQNGTTKESWLHRTNERCFDSYFNYAAVCYEEPLEVRSQLS